MGLDMMMYAVRSDEPTEKVIERLINREIKKEEFAYWRKFHSLNYLILQVAIGDKADSYSNQWVELTPSMINKLYNMNEYMPTREYVGSCYWDEDKIHKRNQSYTRRQLAKARRRIDKGLRVFYLAC